MKSKLTIGALLGGALLAGVVTAHLISQTITFRGQLGKFSGRGVLLARVHGVGVYQGDINRRGQELRDLGQLDGKDSQTEREHSILNGLVADLAVENLSHAEPIRFSEVLREYDTLHAQIPAPAAWAAVLRGSRFSSSSLKQRIAKNLQARIWLEQQIAPRLALSEEELHRYYEEHLSAFDQPLRLRVSHLFLAAPPVTPPETVEEKRAAIENLRDRINHGENFSDLIASTSEDEATKTRGGDLGFFAEWRIPSDFFLAVHQMRVGEIGAVIQTSLGFHIVQMTDSKPAGRLGFDECRIEIGELLVNQKRTTAVRELIVSLGRRGEFFPPPNTRR